MGLAEVYFGMALFVALAGGLWPLVPVLIVGYMVMRGAETTGSAIVEAAPPGDGCALLSGGVILVAAGVAFIAAAVVVGGAL